MLDPRRLAWRDTLIFTRDILTAGERTAFYERVRIGEFVALRRGVYMAATEWTALTPNEQYRMRVMANVEYEERDSVVSHVSAAALWRLPWYLPYPHAVHFLVGAAAGGRSSKTIVRHTLEIPGRIEWIEGVRVTSIATTVVDIARSAPFEQGVAIADAALRRTDVPVVDSPATQLTKTDLYTEIDKLPLAHGTAKAKRIIDFADAAAVGPGESASRANISLAGLTTPQLQAPLKGASGRTWHVDFWWPQFNLVGEFDGKAKYTDEKYLQGRSPQEVVYEEKLREDDLRAAGRSFTRWPWAVATSMPSLRSHLIAAGLR